MENATTNKIMFTKWDGAQYINTKDSVIAHLEAALEENDTELLLSVIGDIARELGVSREGLYRSLAPTGNPSFETVLKLLNILGLQMKLKPKVA